MALMLQNKLHVFVARFFPDDIERKYVMLESMVTFDIYCKFQETCLTNRKSVKVKKIKI